MTTGDFFSKSRRAWNVRALRLLRERACVNYARRAVPAVVDGVRIQFPDTNVAFGPHISVRSRRIEGRDLMSMLYEPNMRETALHLGMTALHALHSADLRATPLSLFGALYGLSRGPAMAVDEILLSRLLSPSRRLRLIRLAARSTLPAGPPKVLLHGDLHASHLIVDLETNSLGFIDLEAMRVGKATTNFAQLWNAYYIADPELGQTFYQRYTEQFADLVDEQFDDDVRIELALRSYRHMQAGRRLGNQQLERIAYNLLQSILDGASFHDICFQGELRGS